MTAVPDSPEYMNRPAFTEVPPDRVMARGHAAGDFLEAYNWLVVEEREGYLRVECDVPEHVLNPKQQLFGGFTPTYVDLISLYTIRAGPGRTDPSVPRGWMTTVNMRIDYYEPIAAAGLELVGELVHKRGKTNLVSTKFFQNGTMAAHALTTLRVVDPPDLDSV